MREFNVVEPIGSLYERSFGGPTAKSKKLVNVVAYCLNPNHFHFILEEVTDGGISNYMKRLSGGYTWYFNNRHKRSGSLFQGKYKYKHIDSNQYLKYVSVYVNLNDRVHQLGGWTAKSSYNQYVGGNILTNDYLVENKHILLSSVGGFEVYKKEAEDLINILIKNKEMMKGLRLE